MLTNVIFPISYSPFSSCQLFDNMRLIQAGRELSVFDEIHFPVRRHKHTYRLQDFSVNRDIVYFWSHDMRRANAINDCCIYEMAQVFVVVSSLTWLLGYHNSLLPCEYFMLTTVFTHKDGYCWLVRRAI